jgi:hypothetical protein
MTNWTWRALFVVGAIVGATYAVAQVPPPNQSWMTNRLGRPPSALPSPQSQPAQPAAPSAPASQPPSQPDSCAAGVTASGQPGMSMGTCGPTLILKPATGQTEIGYGF